MARARWQIFFGTLLLLAVVFKGIGGYMDLYQYLQDAEHLWTRGTMKLTAEEVGNAPNAAYHRFAPGLAVISGPVVLLGVALHYLNSSISIQGVTTVVIPLAGALAAVLLFEISVHLGAARRDALWGVAILVFGSPFLSYSRMFYTEIVIIACLYLAVWAWLRAQELAPQPAWGYWAVAGLALGAVMACHYITVMTVVGLVAAWGGAELLMPARETPLSTRVQRIVVFLLPIVAVGVALLTQNYLRYGRPFTTGYNLDYGQRTIFSISAIPDNLGVLALLVRRTPWVVVALAAGWVLRRRYPVMVWSVLLACVLQQAVWLIFVEFDRFAVRYDLPDVALLALALPAVAASLRARFPSRGLIYATMALILWNLFWFLKCDDWSPPFQVLEDGRVHAYLWYQSGQYMDPMAWIVFFLLLITGSLFFRAALQTCRKLDAELTTTSPVL